MPIIPVVLSFSPKIKTPIMTVAKRLKTDQIVPAIEREFFCRIAGNQAKVPRVYAARISNTYKILGLKANFLDKNSPTAKNKADNTSQTM